MQNFRVYLPKTAWTFGLSCNKVKKKRLGIVILGFSVWWISGVKLDLILALRSQFLEYLRETLYKHALEHLEAARPDKKLVICFSSYCKCLTIIDLFEGL